ncbi:hypothetical protein [Vulcanisaeta sp. JCM 16161]|uniref:hypothetical protein n=1 Tax=Vulcanisaeta sp. JCM 16161 TaxID=1295372 RepID=UPI000A9F1BA6|nr:hypothetical protein [Vulcanisaeta sp. JCM 16161]
MSVRPDFAMLQYTLSMDDLIKVLNVNKEFNVDVYPALLIITNRSARVISRILNTEVQVRPDPIGDAVNRLVNY